MTPSLPEGHQDASPLTVIVEALRLPDAPIGSRADIIDACNADVGTGNRPSSAPCCWPSSDCQRVPYRKDREDQDLQDFVTGHRFKMLFGKIWVMSSSSSVHWSSRLVATPASGSGYSAFSPGFSTLHQNRPSSNEIKMHR